MVDGASGFEQKDLSRLRVRWLPPPRWPRLTADAQTMARGAFHTVHLANGGAGAKPSLLRTDEPMCGGDTYCRKAAKLSIMSCTGDAICSGAEL